MGSSGFVAMYRLLLISALVLGGCAASRQYFQPTERVRGTTLQGYGESIYELSDPHGHFGEAKLWSRGAYRGPGRSTVVQVSIEIHNTSGSAIELRSADVRLDPVRTDSGVLTDLRPAETKDYGIATQALRELRFHFVLPAGTSPGEVTAFQVRWRVTHANFAYAQHTPFIEQYAYYGYVPMYGYPYSYCDPLDPFCFYPGSYYRSRYGTYSPVFERSDGPPRAIVHPRR
jgi:hypothetical protein